MQCKFCDSDFEPFVARVNGVKLYTDFCGQYCERTAMNANNTFEIALPCFHDLKQPVARTIEQFGFKENRNEFRDILSALAR